MVDGYSGFLFLDKNGRPMVALHWEKYFQHIREKYNKIYRIQMPKVTPHVCRHTFCSNMAKSGMNPKTLQYIMGQLGVTELQADYGENVELIVAVPEETVSKFQKEVIEASGGRAVMEELGRIYYSEIEGKMEVWTC